jgi:riboflavin biosynthesis pyrimidine reductase
MGANIAQQCLAEGLADEILLQVVPILLGGHPALRNPARRITSQPISVNS